MRTLRLVLVLVVCAGPALGQTPQAPPRCDAPEYRQFDFWIGDWVVENPQNGRTAGTNRITSILGGCVLHENWAGAGGGTGQSFNIYDRASGRWHQTWVSSTGSLLQLDGGLENDRMVLWGETAAPGGGRTLNRITWERLDGGRVRQSWDVSNDGGTTWTTTFVGVYRRAG